MLWFGCQAARKQFNIHFNLLNLRTALVVSLEKYYTETSPSCNGLQKVENLYFELETLRIEIVALQI